MIKRINVYMDGQRVISPDPIDFGPEVPHIMDGPPPLIPPPTTFPYRKPHNGNPGPIGPWLP